MKDSVLDGLNSTCMITTLLGSYCLRESYEINKGGAMEVKPVVRSYQHSLH